MVSTPCVCAVGLVGPTVEPCGDDRCVVARHATVQYCSQPQTDLPTNPKSTAFLTTLLPNFQMIICVFKFYLNAIFITFPDLDLAVGQAHIGRLWWVRARSRVLKMESFIY